MAAQPESDLEAINRQGDQLYDQCAKPLEAEHDGQFIAIARDGRTVLGNTMLDVAKRAAAELGHGTFLFKVGPRSVGKWR